MVYSLRIGLAFFLFLGVVSCCNQEANNGRQISKDRDSSINGNDSQAHPAGHELITKVRANVLGQIKEMQGIAGVKNSDSDVRKLKDVFTRITNSLRSELAKGEINPSVSLITEGNGEAPTTGQRLRVGYFPVAADPFHWAHLLTALETQAKLKLDKVVFIIGGEDPRKPDLTPTAIRHPIARKALDLFSDFFAFSDIAMQDGTNNPKNLKEKTSNGLNDGETNMFHDLKRNSNLEIDAFYIVGSDHFNWTVPTPDGEQDDTVKKLDQNMNKPNLGFQKDGKHTIKAAFIARYPGEITKDKLADMRARVAYEIQVVEPSLSYSSTQIRDALQGKGDEGKKPLIMLPATTYQDILRHGLYKK